MLPGATSTYRSMHLPPPVDKLAERRQRHASLTSTVCSSMGRLHKHCQSPNRSLLRAHAHHPQCYDLWIGSPCTSTLHLGPELYVVSRWHMKAIAEPSTVSAATPRVPTSRTTNHLLDSTTSPGNAAHKCNRRLRLAPTDPCHSMFLHSDSVTPRAPLQRQCKAYTDRRTDNK